MTTEQTDFLTALLNLKLGIANNTDITTEIGIINTIAITDDYINQVNSMVNTICESVTNETKNAILSLINSITCLDTTYFEYYVNLRLLEFGATEVEVNTYLESILDSNSVFQNAINEYAIYQIVCRLVINSNDTELLVKAINKLESL